MSGASYHLLSNLPVAPSSLCSALRTTALAAGHVAAGDTSAVIQAFRALPDSASWRSKAFDLAILQACPLIGFPRALTAAAALQQAGFTGISPRGCEDEKLRVGLSAAENRAEHVTTGKDPFLAGERVFESIYGRVASKVRSRVAGFHPDLEGWMIRFAYGQVLARSGASLRERELCIVAMLAGGGRGTEPLLTSHCRGALRVGATREEVRAILDHTELVHGGVAAEIVEAVWYTMDRARNIL